eukprot:TRINITY_DN24843_c0_g1_i1.p1 TRINITY_DN24843_c0_g1~~TRINITY_DN24843_c0_g1_i1.p1  ORF type:complete len:549 (+),score=181.54 TRINITY_DN24843_c0_g1_i1:85-1731(+)
MAPASGRSGAGGLAGQKRPLETDGSMPPPPSKKMATVTKSAPGGGVTKAAVVKTAAGGKAPGLSAKLPGGPPPPASSKAAAAAAQFKAPGTTGKSSPGATAPLGLLEKDAIPNGPPPPAEDGSTVTTAIRTLVSAMEASPAEQKLKDCVRLADALGGNIQIAHLVQFLRALKRKLALRAQREGVAAQAKPGSAMETALASAGAGMQGKATAVKAALKSSPPAPAAVGLPAATKAAPKVAKSPATLAKASAGDDAAEKVAKAAIAKTPTAAKASVAKVGGSAAVSSTAPAPKAPVTKSKPATPAAVAAPAAAAATASGATGSDDDSVYALLGELAQDPVVVAEEVNEARLMAIFTRLWDGTAKKKADWPLVFGAMQIPVDKQTEVVQKYLNMAFSRKEDPAKCTEILCDLVKTHKVKMRSAEEALVSFGPNLDGILAMNEQAWHVYSYFLVGLFPKSGYGWARVGWAFRSWWEFTMKCTATLQAEQAFDVITLVLSIIQEKEGAKLAEIPDWVEGTKLPTVLATLCDIAGIEATEAISRLSEKGVVVEA